MSGTAVWCGSRALEIRKTPVLRVSCGGCRRVLTLIQVFDGSGRFTEFLTRVLSLIPKPHSLRCSSGGTGNSCISKASILFLWWLWSRFYLH
jgi:hypothetical protein